MRYRGYHNTYCSWILCKKGIYLANKADDVMDASKAAKKAGRSGKQAHLRGMAVVNTISSTLRGEIKRDINQIKRGKRKTIRVPKGYELAHKRGSEARKGYSYAYTVLQTPD